MGSLVSSFVFRPPAPQTYQGRERKYDYFVDLPAIGVCIPVLYVPSENATARQTTLLFAHGNAEDLSLIEPFVRFLVRRLGVGVAAFEYPGYGRSMWIDKTQTASLVTNEAYIYAAAEGAFQWLMNTQKIASTDIVFYGRSLGSGAAVHLAVHCARENIQCGGLILHSAIASTVRVILPSIWVTVPLIDMFVNVDKIGQIDCRATVVHGTNDEIVPVQCAHQLNAAIPEACRMAPLFIEGARHNDVERQGTQLIDHLNMFLVLSIGTSSEAAVSTV